MKSSIKLFNIFGISVKIHLTFFLLPLFFLVMGGIKSMVLVLIVFICVTMHELTHSLVAMSFGIKVKDITLLPIGGVASMNKMPDNPKQEFLISIAGPLFNIVLAAVLIFVFYYAPWMPESILFRPTLGNTWLHTIALVPWINITLAIFNLLPAFPMDGGRVLRSLLATKIDYRKATRIAVNIGHIFAIVFGYLGFAHDNPLLIFIAIFVYMAASAEESHVNIKETLKDFLVKDILNPQYTTLNKETPLSKVFELVFHTHQEDFPVVEGGLLVGFVTRQDIIRSLHATGPNETIENIMRKDLPAVSPEDKLVIVQRIMEEKGTRALPVAKGSLIYGIITLEDIGRVYSLLAHRH
ncbi:MAG: site-2 protease family protein [Candidatus Omnitrophica bacterium]|nr:site-2 protease family protein [Candidatus Omnitrophota bacterium]